MANRAIRWLKGLCSVSLSNSSMPLLSRLARFRRSVVVVLIPFAVTAVTHAQPAPLSGETEPVVTANFVDKSAVNPLEDIELSLNRASSEREERIAVLIGTTDVSSLFKQDKLRLRYNALV